MPSAATGRTSGSPRSWGAHLPLPGMAQPAREDRRRPLGYRGQGALGGGAARRFFALGVGPVGRARSGRRSVARRHDPRRPDASAARADVRRAAVLAHDLARRRHHARAPVFPRVERADGRPRGARGVRPDARPLPRRVRAAPQALLAYTPTPMIETPVLIVGGGPVGLCASIWLSRFGVPSLLIERHPGTAIHPKARGINIRTMEIFRQCGVEADVRAAGLGQDRVRFIIWAESLTGRELERRMPARMRADVQKISFVSAALCAQDDLEPVLRRHAEASPLATLRFGTELTGLAQDGETVTATLSAGERVSARWVIAADGARVRVRDLLGIPLERRAFLYRSINVLLRADLSPWVAD